MTAAHLVSDLHLDEAKPHHVPILLRFLRGRARELPALYLLGDIFEVWVGDDDDSPLAALVADELSRVVTGGTSVYFMHGNRDFLLGSKFAERAGITLIADPIIVELGGVRTLLTHGDRYCTREIAYQAFRAQSRTSEWQSAILSKTLIERRSIGAEMRRQSMAAQQSAGAQYLEVDGVVEEAVVQDLIVHQAHRVIHGHTHRPREHKVQMPDGSQALRIVLSDWRDFGEALQIAPDGGFRRHILTA